MRQNGKMSKLMGIWMAIVAVALVMSPVLLPDDAAARTVLKKTLKKACKKNGGKWEEGKVKGIGSYYTCTTKQGNVVSCDNIGVLKCGVTYCGKGPATPPCPKEKTVGKRETGHAAIGNVTRLVDPTGRGLTKPRTLAQVRPLEKAPQKAVPPTERPGGVAPEPPTPRHPMAGPPPAPPSGVFKQVRKSDLAVIAIYTDRCECEGLLKKMDAMLMKRIKVVVTNHLGAPTKGTVRLTYKGWRYGPSDKTLPIPLINPGTKKTIVFVFGGGPRLVNAYVGITAEVKTVGTTDSNLTNNKKTAKYGACRRPVL